MISIIIPVLNEERLIGTCVDAIRKSGEVCEIIIADGGSSDRTAEIADCLQGVRVIKTLKGRGPQMNAGAAIAAGDILLFLHADTTLEDGWCRALTGILKDEAAAGGAFTLAISDREKNIGP